jgi:hypothetical protein
MITGMYIKMHNQQCSLCLKKALLPMLTFEVRAGVLSSSLVTLLRPDGNLVDPIIRE